MTTPRRRLPLLLLAALTAGAAEPPPGEKTAPVPTAKSAVLPGGASTANLPPPPSADLDVLRLGTAALKVAGTVQINGRAHLIINQAPYKEGDVLNVRVKGQPVFLRVKNISRYSYTLSLNEAEISVKY